MAQAKRPRLRPQARSLVDYLRYFLTPDVWKQAHQACGKPWPASRWDIQPLLLTLVVMTWCCGDAQAERFESAKAFCIVCRVKQKRPGRTVPGFQKALIRLPMPVLRALAQGVRRSFTTLFDLWVDGFIPLGCDGSRLNCPRTAELERFLSGANQKHSAPSVWLTAVVHLRLGLPWCWRFGKGDASERRHLQAMLPLLPVGTLLVADAGYIGNELMVVLAAQTSFLIRGCSKAPLYTREQVQVEEFQEGECLYWPKEAQEQGLPALPVRALRLPTKAKADGKRQDVWLLTNVLSSARLSRTQASKFYRWRWENEGLFRTYKRTLNKLKLESRMIALVHREAEGSLLALQLLLAQGALVLPRSAAAEPAAAEPAAAEPAAAKSAAASPRRILLEIRREIQAAVGRRRRRSYGQRLHQAAPRQRRQRTTAKQRRPWPARAAHQAPKPPRFLKLTEELNALLEKIKGESE